MNFRLPVVAVVCGAVLSGAVGCASSTTESPAPSSSPPVIVEHGAFAHCLSEHGVTEPAGAPTGPQPGPASAPAGVDQNTWDQAVQACSSLAPGPGAP